MSWLGKKQEKGVSPGGIRRFPVKMKTKLTIQMNTNEALVVIMAPWKFCSFKILLIVLLIVALLCSVGAKKKEKKAEKIGKDITDYNEADIHKLLDQWDENDEDHDPDDLDDDDPRRETASTAQFDPKLMQSDPIGMMKLAKKGKPVMMFATVAGNPTQKETETISAIWQQSLHNAQFQLKRYVIAQNRVLIHIDDGSKAYDIKDFLVKQKSCAKVELENQEFKGAGASAGKTEL